MAIFFIRSVIVIQNRKVLAAPSEANPHFSLNRTDNFVYNDGKRKVD